MRNLKKVLSITAAAAMAVSTVTPVSVFAESEDLQDWCHRTYDRRLCTVW